MGQARRLPSSNDNMKRKGLRGGQQSLQGQRAGARGPGGACLWGLGMAE